MALTQIELIRLIVGDTPTNPFYPIFTDEQYQALIDTYGPNLQNIVRWTAGSLAMNIAGYNTRETTGDISVWNEYAKNYLAALESLISDTGTASIPSGLLGYAAGISYEDVCANDRNPDNVRPGLIGIRLCDGNMFSYTNPFRIKSCGC